MNYLNVSKKASYSDLLFPQCQEVAEAKYPYDYLTERHLQVIWIEQKYFKNLKTSQGFPIEIISPGIWNAEAGPDFLKAHLKIGSLELKGDVEIHLSQEGWTQHHHHVDPRYNRVIFHLLLWKPKLEKQVVTQEGKTIIQAYLEEFFTISHQRILQLIDLDLYPYKKFVGSGKCAQTLFRSLENDKIDQFFASAADWRLIQKRKALQGRIESEDLLFPAGIAIALGFKHNSDAFFELFMKLSKMRNKNEQELLALAMGICGFFVEKFQVKWNSSPLYCQFKKLFEILNAPYFIPLILHQVRPLNHPLRRLVYLCKLLADSEMMNVYPSLINHWEISWQKFNITQQWALLRQQLQNLIPSYSDLYWNHHYNFELETRKEILPLIGESLKTEILVNIFFPLLYEKIVHGNNKQEIDTFHCFYASIPGAKNSKTRYLNHRFFGDTPKGTILTKAKMEQGAYQLHSDFCNHYETSCEGCPFVERYKSFF